MNVKGTLFNPIHLCWQFGGNLSPGQMESHPSLSTAPFIPLLPRLAWGPPAFYNAARTAVWPEETTVGGSLCIGNIPLFWCALDFILWFFCKITLVIQLQSITFANMAIKTRPPERPRCQG